MENFDLITKQIWRTLIDKQIIMDNFDLNYDFKNFRNVKMMENFDLS